MESLFRDLRYGARLLWKDKGFTLTALATLALCTGANTTVFTVVNSVLLQPLPVADSERILLLYNSYPKAGVARASSSAADYYDRKPELGAFGELALYQLYQGVAAGGHGSVEQLLAAGVTPSFFPLLRARPLLGRTFTEEEGELGNERKVVLSYGLWERMGAKPNVVGTELRLAGEPYSIVGVMPKEFSFLEPATALWHPTAFTAEQKSERHSNNWEMIGRLKPGATREQVQAQVDALNASLLERTPEMKAILVNAGYHTRVVGLKEEVVRDVARTLFLLWGGALFVLLIGAVNVANLSLARSGARLRELATRLALGATRRHVARQLLAESVLLTVAAAGLGLLLGYAGVRALPALGLDGVPRQSEIAFGAPVVAFILGLSLLIGLAVGAIPVMHALHADPSAVLRGEGRTGSRGRGSRIWRKGLVAAQLAFALILLMGASLLLASFRQVMAVKPGFDPTRLVTGSVSLPQSRYAGDDQVRAFTARVLEQIRALPGVSGAGAIDALPFSGANSDSVIIAEGHVMQPGESLVSPNQAAVTPGYFETMRIPLVEGRFFEERDSVDAPRVVIVDERLAKRFWPNRSPVGQRMLQPTTPEGLSNPNPSNTVRYEVVGVVGSVKLRALVDPDERVGAYYFPQTQARRSNLSLVVRSSADPRALVPSIRSAITALDPDLPLSGVSTMDERIEQSLVSRRTPVLLSVGFGLVALLLAAIGLYGVLAYLVAQRTQEIGIRMVLGSTASDIFNLVARESIVVLGSGLAVGIAGSLALAQAIRSMLFEVKPLDPVLFASTCGVLAAVAIVACALPAWRATRVSPTVALRQQ